MATMKNATIGYATSKAEQDSLIAQGCDIVVRTDLVVSNEPGDAVLVPKYVAMGAAPVDFPPRITTNWPTSEFQGDFTVEGLVLPTAVSGNQCLFGWRDNPGNGWEVMMSGSGLYFQGSTFIQTPSGVIASGVPFHWRVTRKSSEVQIHIDGVLRAIGSVNFPTSSAWPITVGGRNSGAYPFTGKMRNVQAHTLAIDYSGKNLGVQYFNAPEWSA